MGAAWDFVKSEWSAGRYYAAIWKLSNNLPNLTYPGGEDKFNSLYAEYGYWKFSGPMAGPSWWREVWHAVGGILYTIVGAPIILLVATVMQGTTGWLPAMGVTEASFFMTGIVALLYFVKEFLRDNEGRPRDLKNVVDWLVWVGSSGAVSIAVMLLFGPDKYL